LAGFQVIITGRFWVIAEEQLLAVPASMLPLALTSVRMPRTEYWLCQSCAKLVDNDPVRFSAEILRAWKTLAEDEALQVIGKTAPPEKTTPEVIDKWVNLGYEHQAGIAAKLKEMSFELGWVSADKESAKIDFEGWEYVLADQADGTRARLKIHDHPAIGGYLVLLKRHRPSG